MSQSINESVSPFLLDSHAHLDDTEFDADRDAVVERAHAAGLRYILVAGGGGPADRLDSPLAVADRYDWMYASVGVHPHEAQCFTDSHAERIFNLAEHPKVVALGEIGLDYFHDHSPRDVQKEVLIRQMELARELQLPIIIHCRDAWADLREIAEARWEPTGLGGILHCFTGTREEAQPFIDWGFSVSFAGNLTFKKAENLREVAREIALDRLLTETDCPYLAPVPYRGKRNEPAYVQGVTQELARLRGLSDREIGQHVVENFQRFVQARRSHP